MESILATFVCICLGCGAAEHPRKAGNVGASAERRQPEGTRQRTLQAQVTYEDSINEGGAHLVSTAQLSDRAPQLRTALYQEAAGPAEIPPVMFSKAHGMLNSVKVGDAMPEIALPKVGEDGELVQLDTLFGKNATVIVFWSADRRMAREQLADLDRDVTDLFGEQGVAVVGIAVNESDSSASAALQKASADFPNLLDQHGEAFAKVGTERLPRTYIVDSKGKILWLDIEYSLATRREIYLALQAMVGGSEVR